MLPSTIYNSRKVILLNIYLKMLPSTIYKGRNKRVKFMI